MIREVEFYLLCHDPVRYFGEATQPQPDMQRCDCIMVGRKGGLRALSRAAAIAAAQILSHRQDVDFFPQPQCMIVMDGLWDSGEGCNGKHKSIKNAGLSLPEV